MISVYSRFYYLNSRMAEAEGDRERKIFRQRPGVRKSLLAPHMGGRSQLCGLSSAAFPDALAGT